MTTDRRHPRAPDPVAYWAKFDAEFELNKAALKAIREHSEATMTLQEREDAIREKFAAANDRCRSVELSEQHKAREARMDRREPGF